MIKPLLLYKDSNPPLVFQKEINAFLFSCDTPRITIDTLWIGFVIFLSIKSEVI